MVLGMLLFLFVGIDSLVFLVLSRFVSARREERPLDFLLDYRTRRSLNTSKGESCELI